MQPFTTTRELDNAINSIESVLNSKNSEFILEVIKQYKIDKNLDQDILQKLNQVFSV
jgi:hypothetical protein